MTPLVCIETFQCFIWPVTPDDEEAPMFASMEAEARSALAGMWRMPPIRDVLLAYGVGEVFALFLVRFQQPILGGECDGDLETWVGVGDCPTIVFDTSETPNPVRAIELYCAIVEDWATAILTGRSLQDSYPIATEPTEEHAQMLMQRVDFIREKLIPQARSYAASNSN
jgi:hypothetical protein